jgi:regulator of nucleoside diphosphate kinase
MSTSPQPSIILTRLDVQRLEQLIESARQIRLPGVVALQEELDRAESVVGHTEVPAGVVTMNSRVHCREQGSGKDYHLTLVYPKDANADEGKISILAPVGSALLGLQVGQHINWPAPGGKTLKLELLEVEYQPKAASDFSA